MRDIEAPRVLQKNGRQGDPEIWLVEIYADSSTVYRYTDYDQDLTWNGYTWTSHDLAIKRPNNDTSGTAQEFVVTLGDADLTHAARIAAGKYKGQRIAVHGINHATMSSVTDRITYRGIVRQIANGDPDASFTCGPLSLRDCQIPGESLERDRCNNRFKDSLGRCGYAGADVECRKDWADCVSKSNSARFRGARGMLRFKP